MKKILIKAYNMLTDKVDSLKFTSVKEFCEENRNRYKILTEESLCEELRPYIWKERDSSNKVLRTLPETYVAEIENATVFGENELIMSKGQILSDTFSSVYVNKMHLTKRIVEKIDLDKKEAVLRYHYYRKKPIDKAFNLTGIFSYSYYHFLVNILPKLFYLYQCDEYVEYPLLIDRRAYESYKNIIDIFNIHNRKIVCVGADVAFMVKKLIISSNCAWYDRYVLENYFEEVGHVYDKLAIQFVRDMALKKVKRGVGTKRVYVSRRNISEDRRRLVEEEKVEALFHRYGFVSVCPEELSFLEQVELFSQAEIFAGVSGAAFTNIIFLPEDATIICSTCVCGNTGENLFPTLWNTVGKGKFITLQGKAIKETENLKDNMRKFKLDLHDIEELLRTFD